MTRSIGDADKRMLTAGREIAITKGLGAIRVRDVVNKAKVNIGMFPYHFKNRKRFLALLLEEVYGEFMEKIGNVTTSEGDSLGKLREVLVVLGLALYENRSIMLSFLQDILNDERTVIRYGSKNVPPHAQIIMRLLEECRSNGSLDFEDVRHVIPLLIGAYGLPAVVVGVLDRVGTQSEIFDVGTVMTRPSIEARIDIVLRGIGAKL